MQCAHVYILAMEIPSVHVHYTIEEEIESKNRKMWCAFSHFASALQNLKNENVVSTDVVD